MKVTDFIPYGYENAITRSELVSLTGFSDRMIRRDINHSEELIINLQDGRGYFKPLPEDLKYVSQWQALFAARIRDERKRLTKARDFIDDQVLSLL